MRCAERRDSPTLQQRSSLTETALDDPIALEAISMTVFDSTLDDCSGALALGGRCVSPTFDGGWVAER